MCIRDRSQSYGVHRDPGNPISQPIILKAFDKVGSACKLHGKFMGTAVDPGEPMAMAVTRGATWLNCCHDVTALTAGYESAMVKTDQIVASTNQI